MKPRGFALKSILMRSRARRTDTNRAVRQGHTRGGGLLRAVGAGSGPMADTSAAAPPIAELPLLELRPPRMLLPLSIARMQFSADDSCDGCGCGVGEADVVSDSFAHAVARSTPAPLFSRAPRGRT